MSATSLPSQNRPARIVSELAKPVFFVGFMALVMAASWFMGSADRRLPPRDWLPPLASFIAMLALRFASRPAAGDRA